MQADPYGRRLLWKQGFNIGYVDQNNQFCQEPIYMNEYESILSYRNGKDLFLNSNAEGYGQFALDDQALSMMSGAWETMRNDDKARYAAVLNLYENFHLGNITAGKLMRVLLDFLSHERNELIASTTCTFINNLTGYLNPNDRAATEGRLYELTQQQHGLQSVRQTLLRQLSLKAVSPQVLNNLYDIWEKQEASFLNNRDYMRMAYHLAIMFPERWQDIIAMQYSRLTTEDERREFGFVSRACTPDADVQQQLFNDLAGCAGRDSAHRRHLLPRLLVIKPARRPSQQPSSRNRQHMAGQPSDASARLEKQGHGERLLVVGH